MILQHLLPAFSLQVVFLQAAAHPHKRAEQEHPAQIFQPNESSTTLAFGKPPAPLSYTVNIAGTSDEADTLTIESPRGPAGSLPFELLSQDLLYAHEGACNQLVAAQGDETVSVDLKDGIYQLTSSFRVGIDPRRRRKEEVFTLQQLKDIVEALFEFGVRFETKDIKFSYRLQGRWKHLVGILRFTGPHQYLFQNSSDTLPLTPVSANQSPPSVKATGITDPFETRAWDSLRLHPPATVTFSNYGARMSFADIAVAVFSIYQWAWDLVIEVKREGFNVRFESPLLSIEGLKIDVKGAGGWLPLWVIRSLAGSMLNFWVQAWGQIVGGWECSFEYESGEGQVRKKVWGYVVKRDARPLPPNGFPAGAQRG